MDNGPERSTVRRKHLLTDEQLAFHAGATAEDLAQGNRQSNGIRVHRTDLEHLATSGLRARVVEQ